MANIQTIRIATNLVDQDTYLTHHAMCEMCEAINKRSEDPECRLTIKNDVSDSVFEMVMNSAHVVGSAIEADFVAIEQPEVVKASDEQAGYWIEPECEKCGRRYCDHENKY